MPKQSNGGSQDEVIYGPTTGEQKLARLKKLAKLTTREKLLRIMQMIGDERVGDEQLLRALIVLEGLDPKEKE